MEFDALLGVSECAELQEDVTISVNQAHGNSANAAPYF